MPPGQLHSVYTPVTTALIGRHFYNLDTMHLTEASRFTDTLRGKLLTNQRHRSTLETLCRLVLSLPYLPKTQSESSPPIMILVKPTRFPEIYSQALICLCGMVCYPDRYTAEGEDKQTASTLVLAQKIAGSILSHFKISTIQEYDVFTLEDTLEQGEEVSDDSKVYTTPHSYRKDCCKLSIGVLMYKTTTCFYCTSIMASC
jgi:hypothetical protein